MMYINIKKIIGFIILILILFLIGGIGQMIIFKGDETSIEKITNGKYHISDHIGSQPGEPEKFIYTLVNSRNLKSIGDWIKKYKVNIDKHIIYLVSYEISDDPIESGVIKYHVLNYDTDECNSYSNLEDINELERKIFEDDSNWLIPNRHS